MKDFYFQARSGANATTTVISPFRYFSQTEDILAQKLDVELEGQRLTSAKGRASTLTMLVATAQMIGSRRKDANTLDSITQLFMTLWVSIGHGRIFGSTPESDLITTFTQPL